MPEIAMLTSSWVIRSAQHTLWGTPPSPPELAVQLERGVGAVGDPPGGKLGANQLEASAEVGAGKCAPSPGRSCSISEDKRWMGS